MSGYEFQSTGTDQCQQFGSTRKDDFLYNMEEHV